MTFLSIEGLKGAVGGVVRMTSISDDVFLMDKAEMAEAIARTI